MDLRIERIGPEAAQRTRDQLEARPLVYRRLVLGEDDERGSRPVEARIHATGDLQPPRQREPDVHPVPHAVRRERPADLLDDLLIRGNLGEGERQGGGPEPGEVLPQLEDAPVVQAQPLPDRIAPLHNRVERADAGFVAVNERPVHVDDEIAVPLVKPLQHRVSSSTAGQGAQRVCEFGGGECVNTIGEPVAFRAGVIIEI